MVLGDLLIKVGGKGMIEQMKILVIHEKPVGSVGREIKGRKRKQGRTNKGRKEGIKEEGRDRRLHER